MNQQHSYNLTVKIQFTHNFMETFIVLKYILNYIS